MNTDYPYVDEHDYNVQMAHEIAAAVSSHPNDDLDIHEMLMELDHGG